MDQIWDTKSKFRNDKLRCICFFLFIPMIPAIFEKKNPLGDLYGDIGPCIDYWEDIDNSLSLNRPILPV